ncbi:ubiquitin, partial [Pelagophyceae sp. CCMP2097]
ICIQTLSAGNISLRIDMYDTIFSLKCLTQDIVGESAVDQRLSFNGRELADSRSLSDYNIQNDSTLQ